MTGVIYFAEQVGGRLVKIGWTKGCPKRRVQSLQTGSPKKLRLLGTIPADGPEDERKLHNQFAELRVHGEWFRRSKAIMSLVPQEKKPTERQKSKAAVRKKLNQYLRDSIRLGVSERQFTIEDVARVSGLPVTIFEGIVSKENDDSEETLTKHSRAIFKGLDRLSAGFPVRREADCLALKMHRLEVRAERKAGAQ